MDPENVDKGYDVVAYVGKVTMDGYRDLSTLLETKASRRSSAYFVPITVGGDPDAAYRISRALGHYYPDDLRFLIIDLCKSAGTLMALGANELVISDRGELGPLDVQIANKEELFESDSGLNIISSVQYIKKIMTELFYELHIGLKLKSNLSTKIALDSAAEMAFKFVQPIMSGIDPTKLGEHNRALEIAKAYGVSLNEKFENITREAIERLVVGYPSHSYVIDRKEASELFMRVRGPDEIESGFEETVREELGEPHEYAGDDPRVVGIYVGGESEIRPLTDDLEDNIYGEDMSISGDELLADNKKKGVKAV